MLDLRLNPEYQKKADAKEAELWRATTDYQERALCTDGQALAWVVFKVLAYLLVRFDAMQNRISDVASTQVTDQMRSGFRKNAGLE